jgi:ectoine utilization protein EutC
MNIIILTETEIRDCVSMDIEAMKRIEDGFSALAQGIATLPPIMRVDIPENSGEVDVKTAYIHGADQFAIKIAAGFFENHRLGLPSGSGMMVVVSAKTGFPQAVLLDNGYLTDVRTGLAGAIAANYLAPQTIKTAGVIGAGAQARYQIRGLKLVRDFQELLIYSLKDEEIQLYIKEMSAELGIRVIPVEGPEEVVRNSEVVVTATPSHEPYLRGEWLHPGLHITCMGSDSSDKQELFVDTFECADRIVCDQRDQCFQFGELHHALSAGIIQSKDQVVELGELISGAHPGRLNEGEITICDLTGVGVQDTQIALLAYQRAIERQLGITLKN